MESKSAYECKGCSRRFDDSLKHLTDTRRKKCLDAYESEELLKIYEDHLRVLSKKISCESCNKSFKDISILKHLSSKELCKEYYEIDEKKREKRTLLYEDAIERRTCKRRLTDAINKLTRKLKEQEDTNPPVININPDGNEGQPQLAAQNIVVLARHDAPSQGAPLPDVYQQLTDQMRSGFRHHGQTDAPTSTGQVHQDYGMEVCPIAVTTEDSSPIHSITITMSEEMEMFSNNPTEISVSRQEEVLTRPNQSMPTSLVTNPLDEVENDATSSGQPTQESGNPLCTISQDSDYQNSPPDLQSILEDFIDVSSFDSLFRNRLSVVLRLVLNNQFIGLFNLFANKKPADLTCSQQALNYIRKNLTLNLNPLISYVLYVMWLFFQNI